ncbi:kelch-like protein 8 [Biomphalaria pfeifferi]|uniref:Kelch-like protein 8 n=1 Tax=Biomphalaria pfeifferi TaxID=112525 RepID=A0AAD8B3R9_BIOPF|nr:kelch-like protein 8 [Biomphalaria pfeifferi]
MDRNRRKSYNITDCPSCDRLQTDLEVQIEGTKMNLTKALTSTIYNFYTKHTTIESQRKHSRVINISEDEFKEFLDTIRDDSDFNSFWSIDSILEIWEAVRVLQIPELIAICEKNIGRVISTDYFKTIYVTAKLYQSHGVLCQAKAFLKRMLMTADEMHLYSILSFKDFLSIVKDNHLLVRSEDIVLRSIFLWAEKLNKQEGSSGASEDGQQCPKRKLDSNVPCKEENELNENTSELSQLLRASRYGLASIECLRELSKHHLCQKDKEAKLVITKAINYKLDRDTHGYWPPFAYPRDANLFCLVGVLADKDRVSVLSLETLKTDIDSWMRFPKCPLHTQITNLTVFDNELYVISSTGFESLIFVYRNTRWNFVLDLLNKDFIVISKGNFIYVIDGISSRLKCVSPRETPVLRSEIKFPDMMRNPESALDFDKSILIFCSTDSVERSTVIALDVPEHKWTDCGNLEGSAKNVVGFRNETSYFILQRDGSISQVLRKLDDSIDFIFIQRLWSIQSALCGAFIYKDILYVFSNTPLENVCLHGVSGLSCRTEYWYQEQDACKFVQFFMPTDGDLRFEEDSDHDMEEEDEN